ncbi:hypothetical protein GA830_03890 [Mesorhizobium sp. NBSH29]|uniref:COG4223 family protein n=1 Tax=Mesorhizobium sp. NBSH29 TaxID=2654249 RepID=UPI0018969C4C|nr:hypothetical protein [Mesorhizobium sp. NBSH29]QPC85970.1 hypothetical protein GA830_03890 [Mesorhizobium sp. NBSH29]
MVKPPKIRHSKTRQDPLTIELGPDAVSRVEGDVNVQAEPIADLAPKSEDIMEEADQIDTKSGGEEESHSSGDKPFEAAPSDSFSEPPADAPPAQKSGGFSGVGAGLIGGLIALAGAGGLAYSGLIGLPAGPANNAGAEISALQAEVATLRDQMAPGRDGGESAQSENITRALGESTNRVEQLAASLEQAKADLKQLKSAVESGSAGENVGLQSLSDKVAGIETSVAALSQSSSGTAAADLAALDGRVAAFETALAAVVTTYSSADSRMAGIEKDVGTLKQGVDSIAGKVEAQAGQPKAAVVIAAAGLKAAIETGGPFESEIEAFAAVAPNTRELPELRKLSVEGVPGEDAILAAAPGAGDAMIEAAHTMPADAGVVDRLLDSAADLIKVRPVGPIDGSGVAETVARLQSALQAGDLARAVAEYETLPDTAKAAGQDFMDSVRARLAAQNLVDQATTSALKA